MRRSNQQSVFLRRASSPQRAARAAPAGSHFEPTLLDHLCAPAGDMVWAVAPGCGSPVAYIVVTKLKRPGDFHVRVDGVPVLSSHCVERALNHAHALEADLVRAARARDHARTRDHAPNKQARQQ